MKILSPKVWSEHWAEIILGAFILYAPWFAAENYGIRYFRYGGPLANVSVSGLYSFICIAVLSSTLLLVNAKLWLKRGVRRLEWFIFLFFLINLLNYRSGFFKEYLIAVENALLTAVLLITLVNVRELRPVLPKFGLVHYTLFTLSYFAAMAAPLVFPTDLYPAGFVLYGLYYFRYQGWLGIASYIGFLGLSLFIWSLYMVSIVKDWRWRVFTITGAVLGVSGMYFAVHRTALIAAFVFVFVLSLRIWRFGEVKLAKTLIGIGLLGIVLFFIGRPWEKTEFLSNWNLYLERQRVQGLSTQEVIRQTPLIDIIDMMVQSNGRIEIAKRLFKYREAAPFFGMGTGAAAHYVSTQKDAFGGQPHNDYIRILVDHGWIGFLIIMGIGIAVALEIRKGFGIALLAAYAVCLLADNMMVYPVCGYGPLLLGALLGIHHEHKPAKEQT